MKNNQDFSNKCNVKFNERINSSRRISSFEDAVFWSNKYMVENDMISAIDTLRGWGIKKFLDSDLMSAFMSNFLLQIEDSELEKLNSPYRHKTYYLGKSKKDVTLDLFLSVISYGNAFTEKWVVTHGKKIPITKTMYDALLLMIDIVNTGTQKEKEVEMELTKDQFTRTCKDLKSYAKVHDDDIEITFSDGDFLVECSELGMYRILEVYNFGYTSRSNTQNIRYGYSSNLNSFYFILSTDFTGKF